jgi:hypothetical protein
MVYVFGHVVEMAELRLRNAPGYGTEPIIFDRLLSKVEPFSPRYIPEKGGANFAPPWVE